MLHYFTDSVLQAPTIGCMLMCFVAALVGTFVVLRGKSLIGEALSHACYPGVILALLLERCLFPSVQDGFGKMVVALVGAFVSSLLGLYTIEFLERRLRIQADAALSFVLASFFGIGILALSLTQTAFPTLYKEIQAYLFGQAATMTAVHIYLYAILAAITIAIVIFFFRPFRLVAFDPTFAETIGVSKQKMDTLLFFILVLALVTGIRSVGVVLLSAALIFPVAIARQLTSHLSFLLLFSGLFGLASGFFGVFCSHELSLYLSSSSVKAFSFPTGPMIVIVLSMFFVSALLFSPKSGLTFRFLRRLFFSFQCQSENLLKMIWKLCSEKNESTFSLPEIEKRNSFHPLYLTLLVAILKKKGWIREIYLDQFELTTAGMLWGRKIIRLHRLWELYLVEHCKVAKDRVHPSAEEMEHIITEDVEKELTHLLQNPQVDPHAQPIPEKEELFLLGSARSS